MNKHKLTHTLFAAALALAMLLLLRARRPAQSALGEPPMTVCKDQTYALCVVARCNAFACVAYCQCDVKSGNSISLVFQMGKGHVRRLTLWPRKRVHGEHVQPARSDRCAARRSRDLQLPTGRIRRCVRPVRRRAVLRQHGAYVLGFDGPVPKGQILCSCPITTGSIPSDVIGHQKSALYPREASFFQHSGKSDTSRAPG